MINNVISEVYEGYMPNILFGGTCMSNYSGDTTKLILAGVGSLVAYAYCGPVGLILVGVVLLMAKK